MMLTAFDPGYGRLILVVTGASLTNAPDTLAVYTIEGQSHSNVDLLVKEPKTNHKKQLRDFTNQLNERDRKRRWRK